ncbi:MAG: hypothetical protein JRH18_00420 [Deltaproteobacteria bacterium]|nr:hypothetical protein [Deltaproteobacteria bacterium]MBW1995656.1 hypothetical protein [Deltaproteobacteria bacterium]MBW2150111.1 hypothetical protein [Deltaproteobacteria bacterium]
MSLFPLDLKIADTIVRVRAQYRFKTPDAIQRGTPVACGADYIVTNDGVWWRFKAVKVLPVENQ